MARYLLAGGSLVTVMGAALIPPVLVARAESGWQATLGAAILSAACGLIACGTTALGLGLWRRRRGAAGTGMPSGVRAALAANAVILAFLAFELSDRLIRQDGKVFYWTTFALPPALLIFCGLVAGQSWAWRTSRGTAALGVLWFLGFLPLIPFAPLQTDGVPVPWYGRIYVAAVCLAFAGVLAAAFWSLGQPQTRDYFGFISTAINSPPAKCQKASSSR